MRAVKQLALIVLLLVEIGTVVAMRNLSRPDTGGDTALPKEEALQRYGFYLQEVSKQSGIDFMHQAPMLDSRLEHIMPLIASMSASVSVVDYDKDGWPDLYVVNSGEGSHNCLFRNQHDGTFRDVAAEVGIADVNAPGTGVSTGAVWGDYDNDGFDDLFLYKWGRPELFHNEHGQRFKRVTSNAGLPGWVNANSALWVDYNCDGKLDLFLAGYWDEKIDLWHLENTNIMPESFEYAKNGGRKYLLRGNGDGTFEDVTEEVGIKSRRWTLAAAAANLCGSGYPDLVLANDYGYPEFFANRKGKEMVDIAARTGIAERPKSGMNVTFGDIFNQGRFSIYISNISEPNVLLQGNNLWVPRMGTGGEGLRYDNLAGSLGVEMGGWSWGTQFGDLNNDGLIDLYLTNGYITTGTPQTYWHDYGQITGANKGIISDAKNWPAMRGRGLASRQSKCLWVNREIKFIDVAQAVGASDTYDGRSVVLVDLWKRGVLDVVVANQKGPLLVYQNTVADDRHWVQLDLEGTRSNRSAIGAEVRLYWNGQEQVQEVSGGSGYASQNPHRLHFGLGQHKQIDKIVIRWPSGQTQTLDAPQADTLHPIKEPQ